MIILYQIISHSYLILSDQSPMNIPSFIDVLTVTLGTSELLVEGHNGIPCWGGRVQELEIRRKRNCLGGPRIHSNSVQHLGVSINEVPPNVWLRLEDPMKMDDLGVPVFQETSTWT